MEITSRSHLAVCLSHLAGFKNPDIRSEQYATDSEVAATVLWDAHMRGDITGRTIADLGAGTGILGIGALLLGAKCVHFVESADISGLQANLAACERFHILNADIRDFSTRVDTVLENPPFGTKEKHADARFLTHAFTLADVVYSFHKTTTRAYIEQLAKLQGFRPTQCHDYSFPLKKTYTHHTKHRRFIRVSVFRFEKNI